jgi:hypothetical protein
MKDYSKTSTSGKPAVRQIRGPGMNLGLKKRHKPAKPDSYKPPRKRKGLNLGKSLLTKGFF